MPEIQTNNLVDHGQLKIQVTSRQRAVPIPNATIEISYTGDPDSVLETVSTDENGQTPAVDLPAPPVEYSMSPSENQPYSEYNLKIHPNQTLFHCMVYFRCLMRYSISLSSVNIFP